MASLPGRCAVLCLVAQSCPTLWNPMDCSPLGSSIHGDLQARILERLSCPPPGDLPNAVIKPRSPTLQVVFFFFFFYHLSHQGSPWILEWVAYLFSRGSSPPRNQTGSPALQADGFFTSWATRQALGLAKTKSDLPFLTVSDVSTQKER